MGGKNKSNPKTQSLIFIVKALTLAIWFATLVSFLLAKPGPENKTIFSYLITGASQPNLSEVEMLHMTDVRTWFLVLEVASLVWLLPQYAYPRHKTAIVVLILTLGLGILALVSFDTVWTYLHRLLFRNQLWILPESSYLIEHFFDTFFPAVLSGIGMWIILWLKIMLLTTAKSKM